MTSQPSGWGRFYLGGAALPPWPRHCRRRWMPTR